MNKAMAAGVSLVKKNCCCCNRTHSHAFSKYNKPKCTKLLKTLHTHFCLQVCHCRQRPGRSLGKLSSFNDDYSLLRLPVYLYNVTCPLLGITYKMGTEDRDEDEVDANCPPSMTTTRTAAVTAERQTASATAHLSRSVLSLIVLG